MAETAYIVLKAHQPDVVGNEGEWAQIGPQRVTASSADAAIKTVVAGVAGAHQQGTFVAVPQRSWKPVHVTAEIRTVLKLDTATESENT